MLRFVMLALVHASLAFHAPTSRIQLSKVVAFSSLKDPPTVAGTENQTVVAADSIVNEPVELIDVEVSQFDDFLIQWGLKEDPRVPENCRVKPIDRIKSSGRAGVAAYALTEGAFWISSVPLAVSAVAYTTGSLPDVSTIEGKEQIAGCVESCVPHCAVLFKRPHPRSYVFAFTTFARSLVPLRIALALALAPWCDRNIIQKFFPPESTVDDCEVLEK